MCRVPQWAGAEAHCETAAGLSAAGLDGYLAVLLMGALQARSRGMSACGSHERQDMREPHDELKGQVAIVTGGRQRHR
jgi:hypothetical protein